MELYLLRHGTAHSGRPGISDSARELTPEGALDVERVAERARAAGVEPELMISSTFLRAAQSAEIAARVLRYRGPIERSVALLPDASPFDAWDDIRARAPGGPVLIAAHEPLLSGLAALLLDAPTLRIRVTTACMLAIDVERPGPHSDGVLRWMVVPELA